MTAGALDGLRVLEFAGLGPAPFACMLLADMGADVVTVHRPGTRLDDPSNIVGRGKSVVLLDLKSDRDKSALQELVEDADVLVEGFRPGVMERLGLGPDTLCATNPALVYGRMTGWGQHGPLAHAAGHDLNYIALAGAAFAIGPKEYPVPPLNLIGDYAAGSLYLVNGILAALVERNRSGLGQVIDGAPYYACYRTQDQQWISVAAIEPAFFAELCEQVGVAAALRDAQNDRLRWPLLKEEFASIFATATLADWCDRLEGSDCCFAPVLPLSKAKTHPHHLARKSFVNVSGVEQPAPAPRLSRTPSAIRSAAPTQPVLATVIHQRWMRPDGGPV
jgi:alpha-methylacyl-CoA racemase